MVATYIKDKLRARVKQVISEEQEARAQFKRTYSAASPSLYMLLCLTFPFLAMGTILHRWSLMFFLIVFSGWYLMAVFWGTGVKRKSAHHFVCFFMDLL